MNLSNVVYFGNFGLSDASLGFIVVKIAIL